MTDSGKIIDSDLTAPLADLARGIWWWVLLRGILAIVFGVIALLAPGAALTAIALVFGAYALVDGILSSIHAVRVRSSFPRWGWLLAQGVLSALAGLAALILPGIAGTLGGLVVLWTIVIWNVMHGVMGIRSAAGLADGRPKTLGVVAGVFSILFGIVLGILVLVTPGATLLGLVWAVGIYAVVFGLMLVVAAIQVRVAASRGGVKTA
jgi:uncharacterized membrane protein HdeD (DUF308 family)